MQTLQKLLQKNSWTFIVLFAKVAPPKLLKICSATFQKSPSDVIVSAPQYLKIFHFQVSTASLTTFLNSWQLARRSSRLFDEIFFGSFLIWILDFYLPPRLLLWLLLWILPRPFLRPGSINARRKMLWMVLLTDLRQTSHTIRKQPFLILYLVLRTLFTKSGILFPGACCEVMVTIL